MLKMSKFDIRKSLLPS